MMNFKKIEPEHYPFVARIYNEGIQTGNATFRTEAPHWNEWNESHLQNCRIAVWENDEMIGWAALSPVSGRCVYAGVAELSIYVSEKHRNKGVGKVLMEELIKQSEHAGLWTLQSGIFPENTGSIKLHEQYGFRKIGYREKIGQMNGVWRDTILMERRSKIIGA